MIPVRVNPRAKLAASLARRRQVLDDMFPPARQIAEAADHRARAALVLCLSDGLVLEHFDALKDACDEAGFADGTSYLAERFVALQASRSPLGELPATHVAEVEIWRRGLASIAGGAP